MTYRLTDRQGLLAFEMRRQGARKTEIANALSAEYSDVRSILDAIPVPTFCVPPDWTSETIRAVALDMLSRHPAVTP